VTVNGSNFDVYVNWSGDEDPPCYLYGGQFDIVYNSSLITLISRSTAGVVDGITATYLGTQNGTLPSGNRFFLLSEDWDTWIWNNNNGNGINGSGYWVKLTFKPNTSNTGTTGLNFSLERSGSALEVIRQWDDGAENWPMPNPVWINSSVNVNP